MSRSRPLFFLLPGLIWSGIVFCQAAETPEPTAVPIFSRTQVKYGLGRTDYYNRWVDRPLFVDPALADPDEARQVIQSAAEFRRTREIVGQYGLRGLGFFPEYHREYFYDLARNDPGEGFSLLTDFGPDEDIEKKVRLAGVALENPGSFRIDGKVVIVSYRADSRPPEFWEEVFRRAREKHGDHFLFLPSLDRFGGESVSRWIPRFDAGTITPEQETAIREYLRQWARSTDGLYFAGIASLKTKQRVHHEAFYRDFIIRHMREVLAEPEFAGKKKWGLSACIGHENCTRLGYTLSSDGTATLRRSLEAALDAEPDLIVIPEWDEQNENTSLRPTVYNGRTAMRLLRHYTSREQGRLQEPLADDDTDIPNLILTYRKILVLGETLQLELLRVPESGAAGKESLTVRIELTSGTGDVVWTSPEVIMEPGELRAHVERIPSESFSAHRYLLPVLKVTGPAGERVYSEGWQPLELRSTWNWDYKWVMQPLRDRLAVSQCELAVTPAGKGPDGDPRRLEVSARLAADEPLAYVELLDNDDVIYSHEITDPMPRETEETAVFRIDWQSLDSLSDRRRLAGGITLKHARGQWTVPEGMRVEDGGSRLVFDGQPSSNWVRRVLLSVPAEQLDAAVLDIDLPGIRQGKLPLRRVHEEEIHGFPAPMGFNLVISRFLRQDRMPRHLDAASVAFTVPVSADLPRSRLQLQAVSISGKVYRSRPVLAGTPSGRTRSARVFSDSAGRAVDVEVDAAHLPDIVYPFTPDQTGSVLRTAAGRPFWGLLGGYSSQATGRGGAESRDGTPFLRPEDYPGTAGTPSAPTWREISPGTHALVFDGKSTFLTLPQGTIPRRAGYEIQMEILPDHLEGTQVLLSHRSYYPGSLTILLEEGRLKARFLNQFAEGKTVDSGLVVEPGKWADVRVRYDQETLVFQVDGHSGDPLPLPGPGAYDTVSVVGGYGTEWFAGKLKSLRIRHGGHSDPSDP